MLPPILQRAIWNTYRVGQEIDKRPSDDYVRVAQEVQDWIRDQERQREETARTIAREAESTQRNAALMLTLQVVAVAGMAGATVIVGVTQCGRTSRHRETERTRRVQLLEGYVARYYLPQANVEVRELPGRGVVVVDHDAGAIVPYSVARQVMRSQRDP